MKEPVAGILVEGTKTALPNPNIALYRKLSEANIPIVFFNSCYPGLTCPLSVCADNFNGGYELVNYLFRKGHKSIASVFKADDIQGHERYSGYISAMFDNRLFVSDHKTIWFTTENKYRIFSDEDSVLSSIGDATAVVSFDNSNLSEMSAIKITSLSYGDMNIGTIAAKKLVDILKGQKASSERIPWTLEEKESS